MMDGALPAQPESETAEALNDVREGLLEEYRVDHPWPWIVGYSGGKDSTMVVHLVFEMLLSLPPSQRTRMVHVVANDTLVESPVVMEHITESINEIQTAADAFRVPIVTEITQPESDQSFWVNLIGRGYPSPNRQFRWCTDRMKIRPTTQYIKNLVNDEGKVILLLGVRRSESAARAAMVARYDTEGRLHRHPDLQNCLVFRPIVELNVDQVWSFLSFHEPPWGGSHLKLIGLYRNAAGGSECPVATSKEDVAACGSTNSRFGCWTCTLVEKDRSLEGFVESGYDEFAPLIKFREWLVSIRDKKERRQARRRNGQITMSKNGSVIPGPYTLKTREEILKRLIKLQDETKRSLISEDEISHIRQIWSDEITSSDGLRTKASLKLAGVQKDV